MSESPSGPPNEALLPHAATLPTDADAVELSETYAGDGFSIDHPERASIDTGPVETAPAVLAVIEDDQAPLFVQLARTEVDPDAEQSPADTFAAAVLTEVTDVAGFQLLINQPTTMPDGQAARIVEYVVDEPMEARSVLFAVSTSENQVLHVLAGMPANALDARAEAYDMIRTLTVTNGAQPNS